MRVHVTMYTFLLPSPRTHLALLVPDILKGFLPEEYDAVVENYLYPSYSPQMLAFLAASSLYGLWKTGKLPGQKQL